MAITVAAGVASVRSRGSVPTIRMDDIRLAVHLRCLTSSLIAVLKFCQETILSLELYRKAEENYLSFIENPNFCRAAERAILEKLNKLAFPSSKKRILKAISDRKNQV